MTKLDAKDRKVRDDLIAKMVEAYLKAEAKEQYPVSEDVKKLMIILGGKKRRKSYL